MGFILLDKPAGITSHDAVKQVRKLIQVGLPAEAPPAGGAKAGHAGTLDPFATGLLIVLIGGATRLAEYLLDLPKTYETEIILGATSDTDDVTGNISPPGVYPPNWREGGVPAKAGVGVIGREHIESTLHSFTGSIHQIPPAYAATKIKGRRAYAYAREGERIEQAARKISIYELILLDYQYPKLKLRVTCGRGTYIRALARDIGANLKIGGYCSTLRRLSIGQFTVKNAYKLSDLTPELSTALLSDKLLVDHLPKVTLSTDNVAKFKQGKAVEVSSPLPPTSPCAIVDTSDKLIGIGQSDAASTTLLHPHKILIN